MLQTKERAKATVKSNTFKKALIVMAVCFAIGVFGQAFPEYSNTEVTTLAWGGVIAGLSMMGLRYLQAPPDPEPPADPDPEKQQ